MAVGCPLALLQRTVGTTTLPSLFVLLSHTEIQEIPSEHEETLFYCEDAGPSAYSCPLADQ